MRRPRPAGRSGEVNWDRQLWGVQLSGAAGERLTVLGTSWHEAQRDHYPGEPTRPLLFTSRATARAWCLTKLAQYRGRTDSCAKWRFRPIQVRARVDEVGRVSKPDPLSALKPKRTRRRSKGGRFTCLDCGHRGWRLTIRSRCPMCGRKATYANTV